MTLIKSLIYGQKNLKNLKICPNLVPKAYQNQIGGNRGCNTKTFKTR